MTGDVLLRIASQDTLEAVRDRIGETGDTGGTYNSGTLTSKANAALLALGGVNNGIDGLNNRLDGMVTPYGKGTYGDLIVGSDLAWPSQDGFNRYVLHTKSMTIPEGVTLTPPDKCDGLYILSQGDVTINGVIDLRGKRKTFTEDLQLAPTINVGSQEFVLAKGGYAPKGGANGEGGQAYVKGELADKTTTAPCPALIPVNSISGNVNGGGIGQYGTKGSSAVHYHNKDGDQYGYKYDIESTGERKGYKDKIIPKFDYNQNAPGSLIIIAKGTVTINGSIIASATDGIAAENGGSEYEYKYNGFGGYYYWSYSGNGAVPPSGGGAVTIICTAFVNNGTIDTSGIKFTSANGADNRSLVLANGSYTLIRGGEGGKGGTFISTAGEIKVYTGVSE